MKAKGRRQKAEEGNEDERHAVFHPLSLVRMRCALSIVLMPLLVCALAGGAAAQKRPKPALSAKAARRVLAATPGFALSTGAFKVREVGPAGSAPVTVSADVTVAFRLAWVEDERVPQTGGVFKQKRWRAVEFRTGDRSWEEFDLVAEAFADVRLEAARRALEELVTEFAARQADAKHGGIVELAVIDGGQGGDKKKDEVKNAVEPLTRGPLTIRQLSLMGSSAVAEVVVAATFSLSKDGRGRWRVADVAVDGEAAGDLEALWRSVNARKALRAREEMAELGSALEAFRRERGFYVAGQDSHVLLDHLSPRYAKRIIRLDPWHNPYRYTGTPASYTLASDGPDGKQGTADDVAFSR
jgi:hypothetical protein